MLIEYQNIFNFILQVLTLLSTCLVSLTHLDIRCASEVSCLKQLVLQMIFNLYSLF